MKNIGEVSLLITGANIERFINKIVANGICLREIKRIAQFEFSCIVKEKDFTVFNQMCNQNGVTINLKKRVGISNFVHFFYKHVGLIVAFVLCCVCGFFLSTRVWNIEVICKGESQKKEVVKLLEEKGVVLGCSLTNIDTEELERYLLLSGEEFSLVSVIKRGTSLVLSLKEKNITEVKSEGFNQLVSSVAGVVEKINLVQGTLKVKVGDVVKKGDVLVEPYIEHGQNLLQVEPKAEIYLKTWCEGVVQFDENGERLVETGKVVEQKHLELFGVRLGKAKNSAGFTHYKIDKVSKNICQNMLLPFKLIIERYSELGYQKESRKFSEVYDELSKNSLMLANEKLTQQMVVKNQKTTCSNVGSLYIVSTVIECEVCIS